MALLSTIFLIMLNISLNLTFGSWKSKSSVTSKLIKSSCYHSYLTCGAVINLQD